MKTTNGYSENIVTHKHPVKAHTITRTLLLAGVLAGPLYLLVALIQALTRPGFDLLHHDVSLLSNGDLGWIQISNFLISGLLVILGAVGWRQALSSGRAKTWGPLLLGIYGLGLMGAGIFVADPMGGFPPGTPAAPQTISSHGLLHFITGGLGFLALIASCCVFARRFAHLQQRGWSRYSLVTGILFFLAFAGIATGSGQAWTVVGFWVGVIIAWSWISLLSLKFLKRINGRETA